MTPRKSALLPRLGDAYRAFGPHGKMPVRVVRFVTGDYDCKGFDYADLERLRLVPSDKPGSGDVLTLRFNGSVVTEAKIEGRHLHPLYHWIGLHRLPWLWEHPSPADFSDEKAAVISRITFRQVER